MKHMNYSSKARKPTRAQMPRIPKRTTPLATAPPEQVRLAKLKTRVELLNEQRELEDALREEWDE